MDALTRRRFLLASGVTGAGALAAGAGALAWHDLRHAAAVAPLPAGSGILVLVTLYGGNDGLNTVVPAADSAYQSARPGLAYTESEVLDLGDGLGLNPSMTGLHGLWQQGRLAIVRGVGYPNPNHSHFVSMDIWQTASPADPQTSGWLGRWLDAQPDDELRALRAVSVGATLPPLLAGTRTAGSTLPLGRFRLPKGHLGTGLRALGRESSQDCPYAAYAARDTSDLFTVAGALGGVTATAATGSGGLAAQLDIVASCIESSVPTRVYAVSLGGFDTHAAEKSTQSALLGEFSDAVSSFWQRIDATPRASDVVLAAYTEFGRRVAANANEGTDHGTAGPMFVLGGGVRGGFLGEQPSLTDLDQGDLKHTVDFRSVYASLLTSVLGADPGQALGAGYPLLPLR
ncbi:DUF1501 domain-containing protein [Actinospica durhamensis]|uniref:DUF1501 domain-containing protein n=1 Tax=Actinospica durhamensis TaxID=1508375 RepID=A0A941EMP6_9ACTN|nr:DUF1501 domain-containing protein [Actinospica durhamensis]MBR7833208.1 DUF1501 domain-containing protein [Actinospica durhamensis]